MPSRAMLVMACAGALACAVLGLSRRCFADEVATQHEDRLKARYLLNFAKFVEWPATTGNAVKICFLGGEAVRAAFTSGM
jgi:hypothetical protein